MAWPSCVLLRAPGEREEKKMEDGWLTVFAGYRCVGGRPRVLDGGRASKYSALIALGNAVIIVIIRQMYMRWAAGFVDSVW